MSPEICLLISIWNGEFLTRHALELQPESIPDDFLRYPMEPASKAAIAKRLPLHVRTSGEIVNVERIHSVHVVVPTVIGGMKDGVDHG